MDPRHLYPSPQQWWPCSNQWLYNNVCMLQPGMQVASCQPASVQIFLPQTGVQLSTSDQPLPTTVKPPAEQLHDNPSSSNVVMPQTGAPLKSDQPVPTTVQPPSAHTASSFGIAPCSPAAIPQPQKRQNKSSSSSSSSSSDSSDSSSSISAVVQRAKKKFKNELDDEAALVPQPPLKRPREKKCQKDSDSVVPFGEDELQQLGHQATLTCKVKLTRKTHPMVLVPALADYTSRLQQKYIESSQTDLTSISANIRFPTERDFNLECLKTLVLPKAILIDEFLKLDFSTGSYAVREWHFPS